MAYRESLEERETIVSTTEADTTWNIFVQNPSLKKQLKKFSDDYPELCRLIRHDNIWGSDTFEVNKKSLKIKLLKPISEERREFLSKHAKATLHKADSTSE